VLVLPKLLTLRDGEQWLRHVPLLVGLAVSGLAVVVLAATFERTSLRARVQRSRLFRLMPGIAWGFVRPEDHGINALAVLLGLLFAVGVTVAFVLHLLGHILVSPYLVLCLMLGVVNGIYGYLSSHLRGLQILALLLLLASAVLLNSDTFHRDHAYRMSFPNMDAYYDAARQAVGQQTLPPPGESFVRLDEEEHQELGKRPIDHYRQVYQSPEHSALAAGLIDSVKPMRALCERWQKQHPGTKPRLVIVCTSGG